MTSPIQILARNLGATAIAPSEDGKGVYLLEESEGDLAQQLWVNNEPKMKTLVTSGVMENTAALYLITQTNDTPKRLIFFLDNTHHLRCVEYDEDTEDWEDAPFSDQLEKIEVHPKTFLSGFSNEWGMMIIFETAPGLLAVLVGGEDTWEVTGTIPIQTNPGAAHMILDCQEKIHLFCFGDDNQIHHLTRPYNDHEWKASIVENTNLEAAPSKIVAFPREEDESSFDLYVLLSDSQLIRVDAGGDKVELGVIKEGKLIPSSSAERSIIQPVLLAFSHLLGNFGRRYPRPVYDHSVQNITKNKTTTINYIIFPGAQIPGAQSQQGKPAYAGMF